MSSKSRHDRKSQNEAHAPIEHVDGGEAEAPSVEDFLGENTIHVPEGKNPLQFVFLIGLLIFLLIIFIIPEAFQNSVAGDGPDNTPMASWTMGDELVEITPAVFMTEKRAEAAALKVRGMRITPSDAEMATILLTDSLAQDAGVVVSDEMVVDYIKAVAESLGGSDNYKALMAREFEGGAQTFERVVRRGLRVNTYLALIARVAVAPSADLLADAWNEQHEEFAYGYITASAADFKDAAMAEVPTDEDLELWFAGQPEWERNVLKTDEKWTIGSAFFNVEEAAPEALTDRYPLAEDWDLEAQATAFYQNNSYFMFKRDEEITDEDGEINRYFSQEEVQTKCENGAVALASMKAWRADMGVRMEAGEEVDIALEAQELGLGWHESDEAMTRGQLLDDADFGGGMLSTQVQTTEPGQLIPSAIVGKNTIQVAKVLSNLEPALPAFAEIRDVVAGNWADDRSGELAKEALAALTDAENLGDAEFQALADSSESFTYGMRGWLDKGGKYTDDPDRDQPANRFLMIQSMVLGLDELEEGDLTQATLASDGQNAYLVRSLGSRPLDFSTANPAQLAALKNTVNGAASTDFRKAYSAQGDELSEYLMTRYDLKLPSAEKYAAEKAEKEAKEAAEAAKAGEAATE